VHQGIRPGEERCLSHMAKLLEDRQRGLLVPDDAAVCAAMGTPSARVQDDTEQQNGGKGRRSIPYECPSMAIASDLLEDRLL
jgi:hypothetical protein